MKKHEEGGYRENVFNANRTRSKKDSHLIPLYKKTIMTDQIEEVKDKIVKVLKKHGVKRGGLFGSIVRGEMKEDSDIDILVEIEKDISLLDFIGIKLELEDGLGRKVDLVEYCAIKPSIRDKILKEQVVIL